MPKGMESAASCWEVDRQSCGQVFRPYYIVVLRNKKKAGKSVVKASSVDPVSIGLFADQVKDDLYQLDNDQFVEKYQLGSAA